MNIGILAWEPEEMESVHLCDVARQMGHSPLLFNLEDVQIDSHHGAHQVRLGGHPAEDLDVILSRAHLRPDSWRSDEEILMLLSSLGRPPIVHPAHVHVPAKSKLLLMRRLSAAGIPVPPTALCRTVEDVCAVLAWSNGPIVVKPSYGHGGTDVEKVEGDIGRHSQLLQRLFHRHGVMLAQPYVPHPEGDIRATVIGDEVPLAFRRVPSPQGWKTNVAQGAHVEPCALTAAVRDLSLRTAEVLGLGITGLDIVEHGDRLLVFEANTSPGWYPLSKPEQDLLAEKCIEYVLRTALQAGRAGKRQ